MVKYITEAISDTAWMKPIDINSIKKTFESVKVYNLFFV